MLLEKAGSGDVKSIAELYESVKGAEGCSWDEEYPNLDIAREDQEAGALYCCKDADGRIIAAATVGCFEAFGEIDCFPKDSERACEPCRLCVARDRQGSGLAHALVREIEDLARGMGCDIIRFLAAKHYDKVLKMYRELGFTEVGETDYYGERYICFIKRI